MISATSAASPLRTLGTLLTEHSKIDQIPRDQWTQLSRVAIAQGLGPVLFALVRRQTQLEHLSREAVMPLLAAYGQTFSFNERIYSAVAEWNERFAANGITAIWLKGVALGFTVYLDRAMRPMGDADVLAPPAQAADALALLEAVTGHKPARLGEHNDKEAIASVGLPKGGPVRLELHWSLIEAPTSPLAPPVDWFLDQTTTIDFAGRPLCILRPEANLLYLCAHAILQHGEGASSLLRFYDLHRLITASPALDWSLVLAKATDFGWEYVLERGLSLSQAYFGTGLPDGILTHLQEQRATAKFAELIEGRRQPAGRWRGTTSRLSAMGWSGRIRLAVGLASPPPSYMRYRYGLPNNWQALLHYPYRWWDAASEIFGLSKPPPKRRGHKR